jgi:hypothetical protein
MKGRMQIRPVSFILKQIVLPANRSQVLSSADHPIFETNHVPGGFCGRGYE